MAKAKTPRNSNPPNKQVITMPEAGSITPIRKASPVNSSAVDLESQIRQRAYELYQERGCNSGQEKEDWLRAEREVRARHNRQHSA